MGRKLKILLIEKTANLLNRLIDLFVQSGLNVSVEQCAEVKTLPFVLQKSSWDIIIIDVDCPENNGFELLNLLKKQNLYLPAIFITESFSQPTKIEAIQAGASDVIDKNQLSTLVAAVWRERNNMKRANELSLFEEGLLGSERFLKNIFDAVEEGICVLDNDLNILRINSWINHFFTHGVSPIGKKCHLVYKNLPERCPTCPSLNTIETGSINQEVFRVHDNNGRAVWFDLTSYPLKNSEGKIIGVIHSVKDITRRKLAEQKLLTINKNLEQRVAFRTAQLAAMNKELESFAYSVSHDLRAPLVRIDGFSQLLLDNFSNQLDAEGKHFLSRIRSSVLHMSQLIDDLLQLSRIAQSEMNSSPVDLSKLAQQIADSLMALKPEREANFIIQKDMLAMGDFRLLKLMLENLFNNAWKFTQKKPVTQIEFGYQNNRPEPYYYVKDNGAGFNNSYASKLFLPFQRLHTEQDFPGTGIGLATVKRIVHRHNGKVWAEGKVGEGAVFYFTLQSE